MKHLLFLMTALVLFAVHAGAQHNSVLFISNEAALDQKNGLDHLDQPMIDILKANYDVTVAYTPFAGIDFSKYGMVFIGRAVTSGDFADAAFWAAIDIPVLYVSTWLLRSGHQKLFNTTAVQKVANVNFAGDGTSYLGTIIQAEIVDSTDPAFVGVELIDGKMPWYNGFYDYLNVDRAVIESTCPAKLLAFTAGDSLTADGNGRLAFARFSPNVETYAGSGIIPAAYRTFLHMGADDNIANPNKNFNYWNQTEASLQVMLNEVAYLLSTSKNFISGVSKVVTASDWALVSVNQQNQIVLKLKSETKFSEVQVLVVNLSGQTVFNKRMSISPNGTIIDIPQRSGVYLVNMSSGNDRLTNKVILR